MTLTPSFKFGSITGVGSMSFSLNRGVQPSVATVTMPFNPQIAFAKGNVFPMVISDGFRTVSFRDCILYEAFANESDSGEKQMTLAIYDRRWRWKYGQVSGAYNLRSGGQLLRHTRKTPRELVLILLEAMGETSRTVNLSFLPQDPGVYPYVEWDLENPAAALDSLCQQINCHVCLGSDDKIYVFRDGFGKDLPDIPSTSQGDGFDLQVFPGQLGVASAPFAWQMDLPLEAVGLDTDNTIKAIEQLSYRPDGTDRFPGWNSLDVVTMAGVDDGSRKLARETVFRWYSVKIPKGLKRMPVADEPINHVGQLFPLLDYQLEYERVPDIERVLGSDPRRSDDLPDPLQRRRRPALIWGLFYNEQGTGEDSMPDVKVDGRYIDLSRVKTNEDGNEVLVYQPLIYSKSWVIDNERYLVAFADPVFRYVDNKIEPAKLFLRVAVNLYSSSTRAAYRWAKKLKVPGAPDPKLIEWESREDILPEWRWTSATQTTDNIREEVNPAMDYYLGELVRKYETKIPGHITVPGCLPFGPDGRIAQVVWSIDGEGFMRTTLNRQVEGLNTPVDYQERRKRVRRQAIDVRSERASRKQDQKRGKA